jgi:KEOPS complex subunit Pcc1
MRCCAALEFESSRWEEIYESLRPELDDDLHRSSVTLQAEEGIIRLEVRGEDTVSLRAALNTWIRLVKIAFEMVNL